MTRDSANLSVDFLVGFTIFLLAFIWVVTMVPGLLVNLQGYTVDYDAVAYRTGVILAEDPGEPSLPTSITPWEDLLSRTGVVRFGLAESKDTPNILSRKKVDRFFDPGIFSYPVDYQNRTIFGDYPYQFNISITEMGTIHPPLYVGDEIAKNGTHGSIRRLVRIKEPGLALINASSLNNDGTYNPDLPALRNILTNASMGGDNVTVHAFTVRINKTELLNDRIKDPAYQINPGLEPTVINITDLDPNQIIYPDRVTCFTVNFTSINITNEVSGFRYPVSPNLPPYTGYADGVEFNASTFPEKGLQVTKNLSLIIDPPTYWSMIDKSDVTLWFRLENATVRPPICDKYNGSRFLNNTYTEPFGYNYTNNPANNPKAEVIQPYLQNAILDISVQSGAREVTSLVVEALKAAFKYDAVGLNVQFVDQSKGSPVDWVWDFGDGDTSTNSNPTHMYTAPGTYTVTLTVKDSSGNTDTTTKTIALLPTVYDITPDKGPLTGGTSVTITGTLFTTATGVRFGGTPATGFTVNSDTKITATAPAHTAGTVDVTVTTPGGVTSAVSADDQFTYVPPPAITGISPPYGATAGGTSVTISGTDLADATSVTFGGTAATITSNTATQIIVTTPGPKTGSAAVVVTTVGGTATGTYTYGDAPNAAFHANIVTGNSPLTVTFTDDSTNSPTSWAWTFGDSGTSTAQNPSHQYTTAGTFTVTLTATNSFGSGSITKTGYITVYTVVPFTSSQTWTVPSGVTSVDYLVVGGGGGGGYSSGGGGGAGGFRTGTLTGLSGTQTVTVGGGGNGGTSSHVQGYTGSSSAFASITAAGGGGGGGSSSNNGLSGGSGGGGTRSAGSGGTGTSGQGNNGAAGRGSSSPYYGGGGGGASAAGTSGSSTTAGSGGAGSASSISGSTVTYAGGGGGGATSGTAGSGGTGGGGNGAVSGAGTVGTSNTGGGGGGGGSSGNGGAGGSGIVIIKYTKS